jgi:hypothetical protein
MGSENSNTKRPGDPLSPLRTGFVVERKKVRTERDCSRANLCDVHAGQFSVLSSSASTQNGSEAVIETSDPARQGQLASHLPP